MVNGSKLKLCGFINVNLRFEDTNLAYSPKPPNLDNTPIIFVTKNHRSYTYDTFWLKHNFFFQMWIEVRAVQPSRSFGGCAATSGACAAMSERVQQCRSVCSNVGACAATSERVQQRWSMCSRWERVQQRRSVCSNVGACAAVSERVQQGWSVSSKVGACAAKKKS